MKTNFVLVDFENVQPKDVVSLNGGRYVIKVFLGPHQAKIPLAMARALQTFGAHAEYIQINRTGNNAVDFHIAYYVGRLAATSPDARFYVISKDTGFDPLLKHVAEQGIRCQRVLSLSAVAFEERLSAVIDNLAKRKTARPGTPKALRTTIQALVGNDRPEDEVNALIEQLEGRGVIRISDGKVQYEEQA